MSLAYKTVELFVRNTTKQIIYGMSVASNFHYIEVAEYSRIAMLNYDITLCIDGIHNNFPASRKLLKKNTSLRLQAITHDKRWHDYDSEERVLWRKLIFFMSEILTGFRLAFTLSGDSHHLRCTILLSITACSLFSRNLAKFNSRQKSPIQRAHMGSRHCI